MRLNKTNQHKISHHSVVQNYTFLRDHLMQSPMQSRGCNFKKIVVKLLQNPVNIGPFVGHKTEKYRNEQHRHTDEREREDVGMEDKKRGNPSLA